MLIVDWAEREGVHQAPGETDLAYSLCLFSVLCQCYNPLPLSLSYTNWCLSVFIPPTPRPPHLTFTFTFSHKLSFMTAGHLSQTCRKALLNQVCRYQPLLSTGTNTETAMNDQDLLCC